MHDATNPMRHHLFGLGFWQAWQIAIFCSNAVIPDMEQNGFSLKMLIVACSTLGYLVVMAASRWHALREHREFALAMAAFAMAAGTLMLMLAPSVGDAALQNVALSIGLVGISLGNALLLISWGELWGTLATGRVGQHLYLSYAFAFVLFFVAIALPRPLGGLCACLFPLASAAILHSCKNEPRREHVSAKLDIKTLPIARAVGFILLLSIVWGVSQNALPTVAAQGASGSFMDLSMLVAGVAIGAFALSLIVAAPTSETFALYRPVIPAMAAGLVALALMPPSYAFIGNGLIAMGIYCLDMFLMLVSTDLAFRCKLPTAIVFGAAISISRIGTLVGMTASAALTPVTGWDESLFTMTTLCLGVLAFAGTLVFSQSDLAQFFETPRPIEPESTSAATPSTLEQRCAAAAETAKLTARETEVLELLLRGRTVQDVCDELVIAQGTAKHHVSNIYRKFGVNDRRSLYDAVEHIDSAAQ